GLEFVQERRLRGLRPARSLPENTVIIARKKKIPRTKFQEPIRQRNLALGIWFLEFGSYDVDAFSTPQEKFVERSKKFSRRLLVVSSGFRKCGERKSSPPTKIF